MENSSIRSNKSETKNLKKKHVLQTNKSKSLQNLNEDKILNVLPNYEVFLSVSEAFETALNQLEIYSNPEKVYKKLIQTEKLINAKILSLKKSFTLKTNISEYKWEHENLSNSVTSSMESLCFKELFSNSYLNSDLDFLHFLERVDCPFCSETQDNKNSLVMHLDEKCTALLSNNFKKIDCVPFSPFQILPSNAFKCNFCPNFIQKNISHYFCHKKSASHVSKFDVASKKKTITHSLYCSACKVFVPDNYTQINFHIKCEIHKILSEMSYERGNLCKKNIYCIYSINKEFKCMICKFKCTFQAFRQMETHFKDPVHLKNTPTLIVFCEICSKNVHFLQMYTHLFQSAHIIKEKKINFEFCLYCGFKCDSIKTLSLHMKLDCSVIKDIKNKSENLEDSAEQEVNRERNVKEGTEGEVQVEESVNKRNCLIVKDYTNIQELLIYFKRFGKVEAIKICNKKDVLIEFSKKSSLENILFLPYSHKINGETLKITTDEKQFKSKKKIKTVFNTKEKNSSYEVLNTDTNIHEKYCKKNEDTDLIFDKNFPSQEVLVNLFERAVKHLMNDRQSLDFVKLLQADVAKTVEIGDCSFVGFLECELSLSMESVTLHINTNTCDILSCDVDLIKDEYVFNDNILKSSYFNMLSSDLWQDVTIAYFDVPCIKCIHKSTKRSCKITFMRSLKILSHMLSDCVTENNLVLPFCMLIRFWVSVRDIKMKEFDYVLISLFVYFFKSQNIVKKSFEHYKHGTRAAFLDKVILEESGSIQLLPSTASSKCLNVKELFQEFMKFLRSFRFDEYAICLPLDYPVPRTFFTKKNPRKIFSELLDVDQLKEASMCILDPFLCINLASGIERSDMVSFLQAVNTSNKN